MANIGGKIVKPETAIKEIKFIRSSDKKIQKKERVIRFESLLINEIEFVLEKRRPRDKEGWDKIFKKLRQWFMEVVNGIEDPKFSPEAFNQHYYLIKQKIQNEMEKIT